MSAQDDYTSLSELADRLFGEDGDQDKRERWLSDHMRQLGHRAKSVWEDSTDDGDGGNSGGGGYFGSGNRERRQITKKSKKDWQYG